MRRFALAAALAATTVGSLSSSAHAAPVQYDDEGVYLDDLADDTGLASFTNAALDGDGGWVELVSAGTPGSFTTKDVDPSALSSWGMVYVRGSGQLSLEVLAGGSPIASPSLVASDDPAYTRMASLAAIPATTAPIQLRITFAANGPAAPIVDALQVTWTSVSTLKLAAQGPTTLCSGATGLWKFPISVSNVTARQTVVTALLPLGTTPDGFSNDGTRLRFVSATHGGVYHPGPDPIVVDGVEVQPHHVYWRLGDLRFGSTFPLGLTASIPNGTLGATTYQLTADADASNAAETSATAAPTTASATTALTITKALTGVYRVGTKWRAPAGATVGYTLTVRNDFAPTCRATAQRVVVWDPLQIATSPGAAYPYAAAPTFLSSGLQHTTIQRTLHDADPAAHTITVPANAVYAQIPALAPGASATFEVRLPLSTDLVFDDHVVNVAYADSGYLPHAAERSAQADFYAGIDYTPYGDYAKGDAIRGVSNVTALQDNANLTVGYGEYFKFLLSATNAGASVLRDTTLFDKLPLDLVELVDVYVPPASGATVYYYAAASAGADNPANAPPGYDPATGALTGWTTTRPADAAWVAVKVPRIGSKIYDATNGTSPLRVTAEIGVRTLLPDANEACAVTGIDNVGFFHTVSYEDETGELQPTNHAGTQNAENVTIVPMTPSFSTSFALANPAVAFGSGQVTYSLRLTNNIANNPAQTDDAENVVVRVDVPKTFIAGSYQALDILDVRSAGGSVDYDNLPDYLLISYPSFAANTSRTVEINAYVPKGVVDGATARLSATIASQDVGDICDVADKTVAATVSFSVSPFLQVDKRLDFAVAGRDKTVTYTLRALNSGEGAALDTVITDKLPAALDFVRAPVPPSGMTLWFSEADVPAMPADVRDPEGDFSESFILTSGLFAPGLVSGGYVTSPFAKPTWVAVLVDDPSLTPPQLPATGVPYEIHLEMVVPADAADSLVIANEANIAAAGLLPAVSNRPLLLISDDPALEIGGACPGAIASGERLHLVETFTNNSTNPNTTTTARIAIPTDLVTPSAVTITSAEGSFLVPLPAGDPSHFVSTSLVGTTLTVSWDVTADLGRALAPGESVTMDLDFVATTLPTGTPIPFSITGTATRDVVGTATVNVGTQCTIYVANPDLAIAKLVDRDSAVTGDTLSYTLVVENRGPHDASNVIVREALPAGLAIVPGSVRVSPSGWSVAGDPAFVGGSDPENGGAIYEWSRAHGNALTGPSGTPGLLPGLSSRVYISFRATVVSASAGTSIDNCARTVLGPEVQSGDQLEDEIPADNLDCVTTRVPNPDPVIVKAGPATVQQGQTFAYTLRWWNASRQAASDVVFFERIPNLDAPSNGDPDLTVQGVIAPPGVGVYYAATTNPSTDPLAHPAFSIGAPTSGDWRASLAEVGGKPTWIAFVVGALPGESAAATATINVVAADPDTTDDTPAGAEILNCATIEMQSGTTDDDGANNVSCVTTRIPGLNVALEKTCDPEGFYPGARPGDATSFTLELANRGTSAAFGIKVADPMPAWFSFAGFAPAAAELVDQDGAPASFVDPGNDAIVGSVTWTRVGDTFYLGSPDPAHPTYYRNVGLPRGAKTTLVIGGQVDQDTAAETLATNTATITTDRVSDNDPAEAADLLFDNSDSCELMVHRPDPMVEKRAEIARATVGAGERIDYTIGYDNLGLATASEVVIEDVFPDGVSWVVGSLVDVPIDATVEYYDGANWTTTAPSGADGTLDPTVRGVRVAFPELTAPLAGGYTQKGASAFARGTYDGTIYSEELQAVIVDPAFSGSGTPTYTSPAIPVDDGAILEWISLLVAAAESGAPRPAIEILDGTTGAVLLTHDPETSATDLRALDPTLHPSIRLRASFTPGAGGPDYSGGFVSLPTIGEGLPMLGSAYKTAGEYVAGIIRKDTSSPGQPAMWRRVGGTYETVDLGDAGLGSETIYYLDDDYMVVNGSSVVVWHRDSATETWTPSELGDAYELALARLGGDNAALCGADRSCLFIALARRSGMSEIAYHGPDGWVTAFSQSFGVYSVNSVNTLGYVMFGSPYNGNQFIVRPTGSGWAAVTMPTLPNIRGWNRAILSSDSADALVATWHSVSPFYGMYQLHPSADPSVWTYTELGRASSAQLNYGGPDGSFVGYLGANYFWRRSGASFPSYLTSPPTGATSPSVRVLGADGVAAGNSQQSGSRPTFWSFTGAGYEVFNVQSAYWGTVNGDVSGLDATATLAYGGNYNDSSHPLIFVRTGDVAPWGWDPWRVSPGAGFEYPSVNGVGPLGWVGSVSFDSTTVPAVWSIDALVPSTDVEPIVLETPLVPSGKVLAAAPEGCMLGEIDTAPAQWIPNGDGTFTPAFFTTWGSYYDIEFVAELPGRIFGNAYDADDNPVAVEFVCHSDGFHLEILPGPGGAIPAEVSHAQGDVLVGYDADYEYIFWLAPGDGSTLLLTAADASDSYSLDLRTNGQNFYGVDYWDYLPVATHQIPDADDDFAFQYLDLPAGVDSGVVVHHSSDGRIVGELFGTDGSTHTAIWTQTSPTLPWSLTGSYQGFVPSYIIGSGPDAVLVGFDDSTGEGGFMSLEAPLSPSTFTSFSPEYESVNDVYEPVPATVLAALADGLLPGYAPPRYEPVVLVRRSGLWIETLFGEAQGYLNYAFLGRVQPGVYLGVDEQAVYVHQLESDGTLTTTPIDSGDFRPPYYFSAAELGDIAPDGTFMMWMRVGDDEEGGYTMVAFHPDATSPSGYTYKNLGLEGDAYSDYYEDLSPGQYLGNGCWTAWEISSSGDGGDYVNGYDPNGTTSLRVWGCPSEGGGGGDEALAAWSVAYRGDIQPSLSFQVEVDRVCQREIENTASISTTTPEISAANNTSSVTLLVDNADVAVELDAPDTVLDLATSTSATVEVTIENRGPSAANDVELTLLLPDGVQLGGGGLNAWDFTSLAVGERHTFEVPLIFTSTAANVTYSFAARATTDTIDCQTDNDAVALSLLSGEHPDLRVTKTGPATVRPFEDFAWQVGWFNDGNVAATGFTVTDTLPAVEIVDPGTGDFTGDEIVWADQSLEPGVGTTDEIVAYLDGCELVGQTLTNLIAAPYVGDAEPNDNEAAWTTTVLPPLSAMEIDLVTSQAVDQIPGRFHLTAYYRNSGVGTVQDAAVEVALPAGFTAHADSILDSGAYDSGSGTVSYWLGDLPTGAVGSLTFVVEAATATSGTAVATALGDNICELSDSVALAVAAEPLAIAKVADRDNACTGDVVTWTIVVANPGPSALSGVTVADLVPAGASYVAGSISGPGASALGAPSLTWNIGTLDPGEAVVLGYQTTVTTSDEVLVGAGPSWSTPIASGQGNETAVRIACDNALGLTKSVASACVDGALTLTVTLDYANTGAADLSDVVISDYIGHLPIVDTVPGALDETVSFALGTVAAGQSGSVSYTATLTTGEGDAGQLLLNRAAITASGHEPQTSNQVATPVIVCEVVAECQVDADCDDDDACTTDVCEAGSCINTALACDDGSECTTDTCDPAIGCVYTDVDCGDGSECTTDSCDPATGCVYEDLDCDDGSECTTDSCDPATGCVYEDVVCDDGSECTTDACDPATGCTVSEIECDDASACTDDTCDPATGCVFTEITCDDESECTTDTCDPSTGCEFQPITCDDESECTEDSCDPATGCEFAAIECDDGNACTTDSCDPQGGCVNTPITCSDGDACTTDTCDPSSGCEYLPIVCDDQSACTEDSCNAATGCVFTEITCDDGSECTTDACDPATGCTTTDIECDDGSACTTDTCDPATGCTTTDIECDDQSACTTDTCDPATGCVFTEIDCADDSACTTDTCDPTTGCAYEEVVCDDDNACTEDACNAETGCVYQDISCDDSDACTSEVCNPGTGCVYDEVVCDDGSACTTDSCDPAEGCLATAIDCDDSDACTTDSCDDQTGCAYTTITCDDDDICTADSCDPATGCSYEPLPPRAVECGAGACGGVVDGTETCIDGAWIDDCDEIPGGQIPDTGCDEVRVAYAIVNDAAGAPYGTIRCFQDLTDNVIGCETVEGSATELKIYEAFFCGVQE